MLCDTDMDSVTSSNGQSEKPLPEWLNEDYFVDIIEETFNLKEGEYEVKINSVVPTGGAGENYTSLLYRVSVDAVKNDGSVESLFLFVKAMMSIPELKEFSVFTKELNAYNEILPTLEKVWSNVGETVEFGPKCFKASTDTVDILVLDDLVARNYKVGSRHNGLDMEHVKLLLNKLAKYHAASAVHYEEHGPFNENLHKGMVQAHMKELFQKFGESMSKILVEAMGTWSFGDKYIEKIKKFQTNLFDLLLEVTALQKGKFTVLCHGDLWLNNQLYSYDEHGKPNDVLLIDYQNPYYGSPVLDLYYFIISSTAIDLKTDRFDEMIQYYHVNLVHNLKKLNYPKSIPSLKEFQIELLEKGYMATQCLTGIMAIVLADKCENANFDAMMGEDEASVEFKKKLFFNPRYRDHMEVLLPFLDRKGLLDC